MSTNHEKFVEALKDKVGQTLSTSEIIKIIMERFGKGVNPGSILPNDHAKGNNSACSCAGTDKRIFDKAGHGLYTVRPNINKNLSPVPPIPINSRQISIDVQRGKSVAKLLYDSFRTTGIFGRKDMPEDIFPKGINRGSYDHVLFITLTVAIDYQRDAPSLWESSRNTFEDEKTKYLFNPELICKTPLDKIVDDMRKHNLSKKPQKDAVIWKRIGITFYEKWNADPLNFLKDCNWDSLKILERLKSDSSYINNINSLDYPYLRGNKIGPLWLRMLRDNIGIQHLKNMEEVPIPVDVHIARATLNTGVVCEHAKIELNELFGYIRKAWFESVKDLIIDGKRLIALDLDEPLWHLSKYGCGGYKMNGQCSSNNLCVAREFCVSGKTNIEDSIINFET